MYKPFAVFKFSKRTGITLKTLSAELIPSYSLVSANAFGDIPILFPKDPADAVPPKVFSTKLLNKTNTSKYCLS